MEACRRSSLCAIWPNSILWCRVEFTLRIQHSLPAARKEARVCLILMVGVHHPRTLNERTLPIEWHWNVI